VIGPDNNAPAPPEALNVNALVAGTNEVIESLHIMPEDGRYIVAAEAFAQLLRKTGGPKDVAFEFGLPETTPPPIDPYKIADGRVRVDDRNHTVYVDDEPVDMPFLGYSLLAYLAHPKRVNVAQSKQQLLTNVWQYPKGKVPASAMTTVRVHLMRVRQALGPELGDPEYGAIRTVRTVGYYAVSKFPSSARTS
jgi:DNA-binding response OmpR family regulator